MKKLTAQLKQLREQNIAEWQQNNKLKLKIDEHHAFTIKWLAIATPIILGIALLVWIFK